MAIPPDSDLASELWECFSVVTSAVRRQSTHLAPADRAAMERISATLLRLANRAQHEASEARSAARESEPQGFARFKPLRVLALLTRPPRAAGG